MSDETLDRWETAVLFAAGFTRTARDLKVIWVDRSGHEYTRDEALARIKEQAPAPPEKHEPPAEDNP